MVDQEVNLPEKRHPCRFMVDQEVNLPEKRHPCRFVVDREVNLPEKQFPRLALLIHFLQLAKM